jgi:hypothetical protein
MSRMVRAGLVTLIPLRFRMSLAVRVVERWVWMPFGRRSPVRSVTWIVVHLHSQSPQSIIADWWLRTALSPQARTAADACSSAVWPTA